MKRGLAVGDMVVPNLRHGVKRLVLWAADALDVPDIVCEVDGDAVLTVVALRGEGPGRRDYNTEWRRGACLVLGPGGEVGWVGVGWLKRVTSDPGGLRPPRSGRGGRRVRPVRST